MALFNRKKGDASASDAPAAEAAPADNSAFDFDAISRDLDAQGGASSFDSLLAAPAATPPTGTPPAGTGTSTTRVSDSAFDFPENDPLGISEPPANPVSVSLTQGALTPDVHSPSATSPDAVINAPLAPSMPATVPLESAPIVITPPVPVKRKKSLPLVPLLGALGMLAVAGGGAMFLLNSNKEATDSTPPAVIAPRVPRKPAPAIPATVSATPAAPIAGLSSANPGIAPATAPGKPVKSASTQSASNVAVRVAPNPATPARPAQNPATPVRVAQNPATPVRPATAPTAAVRASSATAGLDPAMASRLKAYWKAGADAKHRRDYAGARKAWQAALILAPHHPGFQDSINKLPR